MKDFLIIWASLLIIVFMFMGIFLNWKYSGMVEFEESSERWELLEKNIEGGWSYWRDKENPEVCFIQRAERLLQFGFTGLTDAVSYVPCEKLTPQSKK